MANCPQCGSMVEGDFGVVTCSHCQSVLIFDLDGNPQLEEPTSFAQPGPTFENLENPAFNYETEPEPESASEDGAFSNYNEPEAEVVKDFSSLPSAEEPAVETLEGFTSSSGAAIELNERGGLTYTVSIEGIDSADLRADCRDLFSDPRFQWSTEDIFRGIKAGRITIKGLNPVKASILVNLLRGLPLEVTWRQDEIHNI